MRRLMTKQGAFAVVWRTVVLGSFLLLVAWGALGNARVGKHRDQNFVAASAAHGRFFILRGNTASRDIRTMSFPPQGGRIDFEFEDGGTMSGPFDVPNPPLRSTSLGFHYRTFQFKTVTGVSVAAPQWMIGLLVFSLVGVGPALRRSRRSRRRRHGQCVTCGYDIRATPDACPECGASGA
jgi:hypothetical protein